jgi:hypothetical protein
MQYDRTISYEWETYITTYRNIEMASHFFRASHQITTYCTVTSKYGTATARLRI